MQINLGFEHYKHIKNVLFAFKFQLYITAHSFPRYAPPHAYDKEFIISTAVTR